MPFETFLTEQDHDDLRWYLEEFMDLPDGGSIVRANSVEADLTRWGRMLHDAVFSNEPNRTVLSELWQSDGAQTLTIATSDPTILRLPWELLADNDGPLQDQGLSIRRQLEGASEPKHRKTGLPLRILLVVSRPADQGFIDPRLTPSALLKALEPLGDNVHVDFVRPPTLDRLRRMLVAARDDPYDMVHFDGHGTFESEIELGALCFEQGDEHDEPGGPHTDYVRAGRLGRILLAHRVPLVILEACRSGQVGKVGMFQAVAPALIRKGVGSVVAMSHSIHVAAAHIFLERFYRDIAAGATVGQAVEQGRAALAERPARWLELGPGARTVNLRDWFLPQIYQRGEDGPILPPEPTLPDEFDVFLSHNHADAARVERLAIQLRDRYGLRVWLDKWEVGHGLLHEQCVKGVAQSRVILLACTKQALESKWVTNEKNWAFAANRTGGDILPLLFEDVELPLDLTALLCVDFKDPEKDADQVAEVARLVGPPLGAAERPAIRRPAKAEATGAFPRPPRYGFQGRARELHELERQFRHHRSILLHAMGGMGKTTLATEAADWWCRSGLFPDGACFVSFEQFTSADRVVQVLGEYLEGVSFNSQPIEDQYRRAKELFQEKRVLMVWDNFERVLPAFQPSQDPALYSEEEHGRLIELFEDWNDSDEGHGRLLITCRPAETPLAGAHRYELSGLLRPDSLWLMVRVLEKAGVKPDDARLGREKLDTLLDALADHPLSIELVGPHLKKLTPEKVVEDFGRLLEEFKRGEAKERNESLLASLAFSTRRLSAETQKILPWLGLFRGGVFEDNLLDVGRIEAGQWEQARAELDATALVRVERDITLGDRPYLRFHPTLAYAASTGDAAHPDEVRQRFIAVYDALDTTIGNALGGSNPRDGMEVMAREEANFRTAVTWALAEQAYTTASAMGNTFRDYLERCGRLRERDSWVAWLAREVGEGGFSEAAAGRERDAAWSLLTQGRTQEAIDKLQALIERLTATSDFDPTFQLTSAQGDLGRVYLYAGLATQAISVLKGAIRAWEALTKKARARGEDAETERGNLSATLGDLANALTATGQLDKALEAVERARSIQQELGRHRDLAAALGMTAQILMEQGRFQEAEARYEETLVAARRAGDKELEATTLQHQGRLAVDMGQYDRAANLYKQALGLVQEMGHEEGVMLTCNLLGIVERKSGRLAEARAWYERSRQIARDRQDKESLGIAAQNIGIVCQHEGEAARAAGDEAVARERFAEAARLVAEALKLRQQQQDRRREAESQIQLAQIKLLLGELGRAEEHALQGLAIDEELQIVRELPSDYNTLAEIAWARGDNKQAVEWEGKRDAVVAVLERRAQGGGGLPREFVQAIQGLAVACARAGFGAAEPVDLEPQAEAALAQIEKLPAPMPAVAGVLRALAGGEIPTVPEGLPDELREMLSGLIEAIKEQG